MTEEPADVLVCATSAPAERPPSEFAEQAPQLDRLASLPPGHPERERLRTDVILALLPVGERIATRFATGNPAMRDDLRQVAAVGVVQAVDRWDPERAQGDVLGYIVPCVRGTLLRHFRDTTWSTRVPRRLKELSSEVHRAGEELTRELGRAPRPSELARHLDAGVDEVIEALQVLNSRRAATIDAPVQSAGATIGERLGTDDHDLELVDDVQSLKGLLATLPEREHRIIVLRFFGDRTQSQIAEEIGISQMHVSRLLGRTIAKLRHGLLDDEPAPG
jgi:RNA polymerase sigma-B factor